jgi:hypothetical protein
MEGRRRWFGRRPRADDVPPDVTEAAGAFPPARDAVERAKASLMTAIRSGRAPGAPLAEALAGFEHHLADADTAMPGWRMDVVRSEWAACRNGLDEARRRAETLRLEGSPEVYEELATALADLMEPLEPFADAARRLRDLGARLR